MKFWSIGIRARSRSSPRSRDRRAGFTLIEALVALAIVLMFATTIVPFLFQSRRIVAGSDDRLAAHVMLRSLISAPIDRASPGNASRSGKFGNINWAIRAEPVLIDALPLPKEPKWVPMRVLISVAWGPQNILNIETVRLGVAK